MIKVYGQSDDLIEIVGDIEEEFGLGLDEAEKTGVVLAFSCGTLIKVKYENDGLWRITTLVRGRAQVTHTQAIEADGEYSDTLTIDTEEDVAWVAKGDAYILGNRPIVDLNQCN